MDSTRSENAQLDRLSALPNSVLTHILSFLPTKQAASTSILSKPWRNLWISIPDLEFDDSCLAGHCSCLAHDRVLNFLESINLPFYTRKNPIRRFGLRCLNGCNPLFISSWVSLALPYEPSEVNVEVRAENLSPVPTELFAGVNLVKLELSGSIMILVKDFTVSLPSVKTLRLDNVRYSSPGSIEKIVSGCPVLEDLDIARSVEDEDLALNITAPSLKSLRISFEECDYHLNDVVYVLEINAPNIVELHLKDKVTKNYVVDGGLWNFMCEADVDVKDDGNAFAVFKALANATELSFSGDTLVSLLWDEEEQYNMPAFLNLSQLELGIEDACLELVNMFLLSSPNLEVLVFKKECEYCGFRDPLWTPPIIVPICLRLKLKIICFEDLSGNEYEIRMIRYLLLNARVLVHMIIQCPTISESLARQLNNFQRHGNLHLIP